MKQTEIRPFMIKKTSLIFPPVPVASRKTTLFIKTFVHLKMKQKLFIF